MHIQQITIRNYSVHRETTVRCWPITVLIGPNGSGKSALFDALINFSMIARGSLRQAFGPFPFSYMATRFRGALPYEGISFEIVMTGSSEEGSQLRYDLGYQQDGQAEGSAPAFRIERETLWADSTKIFDRAFPHDSPVPGLAARLARDTGIFAALRRGTLELGQYGYLAGYARDISRFNRFRLSPDDLARPARLPSAEDGDTIPYLGYEGEGLASCLYALAEAENPALQGIVGSLREVHPRFREFEFTFVGSDRVAFAMAFDDARGSITAARLSHGTLALVGLLVPTHHPQAPAVIMVEEPENGLTPKAARAFYGAVRNLAFSADPAKRSQVLISSHSPFVLCDAWNGEDRNFIHQFLIENGAARVRPLSDAIVHHQVQLGIDENGNRTVLGLRNAEELICGYFAQADAHGG